jgi:hypothetical protein
MLKAIHAQEDLAAAQRKAADVVARLGNTCDRAGHT